MKIDNLLTDDAVLAELGRRIAEIRLAADLTQADLAAAAGVSKRTVERLEAGFGGQLVTLVRCLRALNRADGLDLLVPQVQPNPLDLLKHRRRTARSRARPDRKAPPPAPWTWGDEK
jgi:transcriptional regulator with XRE-family HTH domain